MSEPVDRPTILNPEAVGDPNQTPIVQLPPEMVAYFERTRCPDCRYINHLHADDCSREKRRDDHAYWASVCICGMGEQERTGHYPEHESWCEVPSPLDDDDEEPTR